MLREGIELEGKSVNLDGLTDPECLEIRGIPHSDVLLKFANAFMGHGDVSLEDARQAIAEATDERFVVDAAGVASTFQRMDRIADATGIPSDGPVALMQEDLASMLGTDQYQSAKNTRPIPWFKRLLLKTFVIPQIRKMIREKSS